MDLSRLRTPSVLGVVLVGLLLAGVALFVLQDGDDPGGQEEAISEQEVTKTAAPCELWTTSELQEWLGGSPWEVDDDLSTGPTCVYREVEGPGTVSLLINETPSPALFDTLRSGRDASPLDGVGDEAWWWEVPDRPGGALVMRVGGRAATIDLSGQYPDRLARSVAGVPQHSEEGETEDSEREEDLIPALGTQEISVEIHRRLTALAGAVADRLEPLPFEAATPEDTTAGVTPAVVTVGEALCAALSLDALSADMQVSTDGAALTPMGERGCAYSNVDGVNVTLELVAEDVDGSALEVARELTIDGETFVWEPETVPDLGDGAVWMADPATGTTGELNALFDGALVRVSSSGPEAEGLKDRAVAAARLVGPDVAGLDEGDR